MSENESAPIKSSEAALLDVKQVAGLLNCSARHVYRLSDGGNMPRPIKLGRLVRWNVQELEQWIAAGCPTNLQRRSRGQWH